jgi:hypothetical protein
MPMRFDRRGWVSLAALVACLFGAGVAQASPRTSNADRSRFIDTSSVAQARCYGRYVAWRDALYGTIQQTDSWLSSAEPVAEFDLMQASFVAQLSNERGVTLRFSPDLDETALPADIRAAYDRGLQETGALFESQSFRDRQARAAADTAQPGADRMAGLQAVIDDSFSGLRAPCTRLIEKRRMARPAEPPTRDQPKIVSASAPTALAPQPDDPGAAGLSPDWPASQWLQIGVFQRGDASSDSFRALQSQMPAETAGLSERTEAVKRFGRVQHIALVGPFISPAQAQSFCDKLKAKGGDCSIRLTNTLGPQKKPPAWMKLVKARASMARLHGLAHRSLAQASPRHAPAEPLERASLSARLQVVQAGLRGRLTE